MAEEKNVETQEARLQIGNEVYTMQVPRSWEGAPLTHVQFHVEDKASDKWELEKLDTKEKEEKALELLHELKYSKIVVLGNVYKVKFEARSGNEVLKMEEMPADFQLPERLTRLWEGKFDIIRTLAHGIAEIDGQPMPEDVVARLTKVGDLPNMALKILADEWNVFEREQEALLTPEVIGDMVKKY